MPKSAKLQANRAASVKGSLTCFESNAAAPACSQKRIWKHRSIVWQLTWTGRQNSQMRSSTGHLQCNGQYFEQMTLLAQILHKVQSLLNCNDVTHSGNMRPASMRMYLSYTPTSMQFMPISPSPPTGNTLRGGPSPGGGPGKGLFGWCCSADPKCCLPSLCKCILLRVLEAPRLV